MAERSQLVVFKFDQQMFALHVSAVEQVISAVEITPLPEAPHLLAGIINFHGRIVPVINLRWRLGLPERELELNDQFIIAHSSSRTLALIVDQVDGLAEEAVENIVKSNAVFPGIGLVEGVMRLNNGLLLIFDLDQLIPLHQENELMEALKRHSGNEESNKLKS